MKKLVVLMFAISVSFIAVAGNNNWDKAMRKEAKKSAADFKKDGWKSDMPGSISDNLYYFSSLQDKDMIDIIGTSYDCDGLDEAQNKAANNAALEMTKTFGTYLQLSNSEYNLKNGQETIQEWFHGEFILPLDESELEQGAPSRFPIKYIYELYRERKDGKFDCRIYYIIDYPDELIGKKGKYDHCLGIIKD